MQRLIPRRIQFAVLAFALALAALMLMPFAAREIGAATPSPEPSPTATAAPTRTLAPTSTPTATPPVITAPLPSLEDLRHFTPVPEVTTEEPVVPDTPTPTPSVPIAAPAGQNQPPRVPVRAATPKGPAPTKTPAAPPAAPVLEVAPEPTAKSAAPLPPGASRTTRLPAAPVSNAQPPINLTPAGVAGGGPAEPRAPLASNALIVVGIGLLAAGGSWGFYYLLRESD